MRLSLAKDNIRVMNIAPALIETPLQHRIRKIDKGLISAHEFALIIKSLIELPQHINIRDMVIAPTDYEG